MKRLFQFYRALFAVISLVTAWAMFPAAGVAQTETKVQRVNAPEGVEGSALTVSVELARTDNVGEVTLVYRSGSSVEYKRLEMLLAGNTATATIPVADVLSPSIEYYLILQAQAGAVEETYPAENPAGQPLRINVRAPEAKDNMIVFLSPEPGSKASLEDLLISVSFPRAGSSVNIAATKVFIDDKDVTAFAIISGDVLTLLPENLDTPLPDGPHIVRIELFDKEGQPFHSSSLTFTQTKKADENDGPAVTYNLAAQLEARNEKIREFSTSYNRGNLTMSSEMGMLRLNGRLYVTNEDEDFRQPQNRYFAEAFTSWLRVGYGDGYPTFPSLIMTGKRVRGLTSNLALGFLNVDFAQGEITRKIDGDTIRTFSKDSLSYYQDRSSAIGPFPGDASKYAMYRYGTFTRDITALRPSFGSGKNFQWGFSYLKSKDDVGSIAYGIKPQENLVGGTDLLIAFDDHKFELTGQAAASVYNSDISRGSLTDAEIDSLFQDADSTSKREDAKSLRDRLSQYITVNTNLVPLGTDQIQSILSYEGGLTLNYFDNYLKGTYIYRGNNFRSFGQSFIRNDVKGFNVFDRVRLFRNQFFLSAGLERLEDNTDATKPATTTFTNLNTTLSYFPRIDFPNITIGYSQNKSTNGLVTLNPAGPDSNRARSAIEDQSNRIFVQATYDFMMSYQQTLSVNFSTFSRDDQTVRNLDSKNSLIAGSVTTSWSRVLQSTVGLTLNLNELPEPLIGAPATTRDYNYNSLLIGARYRMLEDKLRASAVVSPTFGDLERMMWDLGLEYSLMRNVIAASQFSVLNNTGVSTDVIWSVMLRYNL